MSFINSARTYHGNADRLRRGAELGNPYAAWKLGNWYFEGRYVSRDYASAKVMYKMGILNGCFLCMRSLAYMLVRGIGGNQDLETGLQLFEAAAHFDAISAHEAGLFYFFGQGVEPNATKARSYLTVAAKKKYRPAMVHLAVLDSLDVLPRSPGETQEMLLEMSALTSGIERAKAQLALFLFRSSDIAESQWLVENSLSQLYSAAAAGLPDAMYHLGNAYLGSPYASRDLSKAYQAFSEAAHAGNTDAMIALADLYESGETFLDGKEKGLQWVAKAYDAGSPAALRKMAERSCKENRHGIYDPKLARMAMEAAEGGDRLAWCVLSAYADSFYEDIQRDNLIDPNRVFYMAIAYGEETANFNAARHYMMNQHVPGNLEKGVAWLECGIDDGVALCAHLLGRELINGKMGFPSNAEGVVLLELAISKGCSGAASFLGYQYLAEKRSIKNPIEAKRLLEIAADSGDIGAMHSLGIMLMEGSGTSIDYERGYALIEKSQQLKRKQSLELDSSNAESAKLSLQRKNESKRQMAQVIHLKKNSSQQAS